MKPPGFIVCSVCRNIARHIYLGIRCWDKSETGLPCRGVLVEAPDDIKAIYFFAGTMGAYKAWLEKHTSREEILAKNEDTAHSLGGGEK